MSEFADQVFVEGRLQIGVGTGVGVLMIRDEVCYGLSADLSWQLIPWLDDPVEWFHTDSQGVQDEPSRQLERVFSSYWINSRIVETLALSDSYLVAGDLSGRYLKDRSGAWKYSRDLDSFWRVEGNWHGVFAGVTTHLFGLGLSGGEYPPDTFSLVYRGSGYRETMEPVSVSENLDLEPICIEDPFLGFASDGVRGVRSDCNFSVFVVEYPGDGELPRVVDSPKTFERRWGRVSAYTREFCGMPFFREVGGDIWVFAGQDWGCGNEIDVTQLSIIRSDFSVVDLAMTGFPSVEFGDRLAVVDDRVFAAHDRKLYELDIDSLHFSTFIELSAEVVSLLNFNDELLAFTLDAAVAMPVATKIPIAKR